MGAKQITPMSEVEAYLDEKGPHQLAQVSQSAHPLEGSWRWEKAREKPFPESPWGLHCQWRGTMGYVDEGSGL